MLWKTYRLFKKNFQGFHLQNAVISWPEIDKLDSSANRIDKEASDTCFRVNELFDDA